MCGKTIDLGAEKSKPTRTRTPHWPSSRLGQGKGCARCKRLLRDRFAEGRIGEEVEGLADKQAHFRTFVCEFVGTHHKEPGTFLVTRPQGRAFGSDRRRCLHPSPVWACCTPDIGLPNKDVS